MESFMRVVIHKITKNAMQSGRGKVGMWKMDLENAGKFIDPLMGWVGQSDTTAQLKLVFETAEQAVAYAQKRGFEYVVKEDKPRKIIGKNYADNFSFTRVARS